jgi:hypothetical protein
MQSLENKAEKKNINATQTETDTKQTPGHNKRTFLGAKIRFLEIALGATDGILLAVGGVLASYHSHVQILGISFILSAVFWSILLINLHWRTTHTRQKPLAGLLSKIIFGTAILCLVVGVLVWLLLSIPKGEVRPFKVSCKSPLITPGRPLLAPMMVEYSSKYGPTISPVHLMVSVTIVNLQPGPSTLEAYSLEWSANEDGPWATMKPISLLWNRVYWAYDIKSAVALDMSANGLDFELKGKQLNSHESVRGWTLWECPEPSGCTYSFMKFSFRDTAGLQGSDACSGAFNPMPEAEVNTQYWKVLPGRFDLSNAHLVFMSECCS